MFEEIIKFVNQSKTITIFPHTNIDGDAVGSSKALALALIKAGKQVEVLCDEAVPSHVGFLNCDLFKTDSSFAPDCAFAVDCSDFQRIENRIEVYKNAKYRVCIDHHPGPNDFADVIVRDADAPAAAMLVYKFIKELGVEFDKDIAEALYTGILTDTGAFKYSNTTAETHLVIADLYQYGIDHTSICVNVFDNKPLVQIKLESIASSNMEIFADGKAVISYLNYKEWNSLGAQYSDTDSSIDVIRKIQGTEIAAILKEKEPGVFKLSMRSKSYADVSEIAFKLGGGGHVKAAACTLNMSFEDAYNLVKDEICKVL